MRASLKCWVPAAVLLAAPAAYAQQAGTYTGTNDEGYQLEVVVSGTKGDYAVTGVSDGALIYCGKTEIGGSKISLGGDAPITGHEASLYNSAPSIWYQGYFHFKGDTVVAKQEYELPVLTGTGAPPKSACPAKTGYITTTLTYSGGATRAPGPTVYQVAPIDTRR